MLISAVSSASKSIYFSRPVAIGSAIFCAVPALEMAYLAYKCLDNLKTFTPNSNATEEQNESTKQCISHWNTTLKNEALSRAASALFFGAASVNYFPGSAATGALALVFFARAKISLSKGENAEYKSFSLFTIRLIDNFKKQIANQVWIGVKFCAAKALFAYNASLRGGKVVLAKTGKVLSLPLKGAKAVGRGCTKVLALPLKGAQAVGRGCSKALAPVAKGVSPLVRNPKALAITVGGVAALILTVRFIPVTARVANFCLNVMGIIFAESFKTAASALGAIIRYTPTVIGKAIELSFYLTARVLKLGLELAYHSTVFTINAVCEIARIGLYLSGRLICLAFDVTMLIPRAICTVAGAILFPSKA